MLQGSKEAEPFYLHPPNDDRSRRKREGRDGVRSSERLQSSKTYSRLTDEYKDGYDNPSAAKFKSSEHLHMTKDSSEYKHSTKYTTHSHTRSSEHSNTVNIDKSKNNETSSRSRDSKTNARHSRSNKDSSRTRDSQERSEKTSQGRSGSDKSDTHKQNRSQSVDRPDHKRNLDTKRSEKHENRRSHQEKQDFIRKQAFTRSKSHDDFSERKGHRQYEVEDKRKSYSAECEPSEPFYLHTPASSSHNGYDRIQSLFYEVTEQKRTSDSGIETSKESHESGYSYEKDSKRDFNSKGAQHREYSSERRHSREYSKERRQSQDYSQDRRRNREYSHDRGNNRDYSPEKRQSRHYNENRRKGHNERSKSPKRRAAPAMPLPSIDYDGRFTVCFTWQIFHLDLVVYSSYFY